MLASGRVPPQWRCSLSPRADGCARRYISAQRRRSLNFRPAQEIAHLPRTPDDLPPGFYWVRVDGLPPEVARRDAERASGWVKGLRDALAEARRPFWRRWLG
jgi:hypothetical protein